MENAAAPSPTVCEPPDRVTGDYGNEIIYMLAASGLGLNEIVKSSGVPREAVEKAMKVPGARDRIRELQGNFFGRDLQKRFKSIAHKAVDTLESIMDNEGIKPTTRLAAASEVLDRAVGKPKQYVEHSDGNLRELYEKMDEVVRQRQKPAPITIPGSVVETPPKIRDTESIQTLPENGISKDAKDDEIDKWFAGRGQKAPTPE